MTSTTADHRRAPGVHGPQGQVAGALSQLDRHRRDSEAHSSLGAADGRLMWLFSDRRARTMRQVSEELGLEQSTVNRQVNAALRTRLLRRYREPGQPAALLAITDAGAAAFAHDLDLHLGLYRQALDALAPAQRGQFVASLAQFVAAYGRATEQLD